MPTALTHCLSPFLKTALESTDFKGLGKKYIGKVRDVYEQGERSILIATDRQSAFDVSWCTIPLKGQALNQLSAWWFEKIKDLMPTHVIAVPDPNAMVVKKLKMLKVEIVVRGYLTGSTDTSAWINYHKGVRNFCGNRLPEGMRKNEKFDHPIITPTTKSEHDELIDPLTIIHRGLASPKQWAEITDKAFAVFRRGQEIALAQGLILVDTKYEMGLDDHGTITMADEVHTPDSSRYFVAATYEKRHQQGLEPESLDKEFFRLWLKEQGLDVYDPSQTPKLRSLITDDVRVMLAEKYIELYERMTGEAFAIPKDSDVKGRMERNLREYKSTRIQEYKNTRVQGRG